jgi:hypothetical protein
MIPYFKELGFLKNLDEAELKKAGELASKIFI